MTAIYALVQHSISPPESFIVKINTVVKTQDSEKAPKQIACLQKLIFTGVSKVKVLKSVKGLHDGMYK